MSFSVRQTPEPRYHRDSVHRADFGQQAEQTSSKRLGRQKSQAEPVKARVQLHVSFWTSRASKNRLRRGHWIRVRIGARRGG